MYLKTLTLRGFKSFASATTLQFEPGVTCVVGPNGSGKSNVVDALAWVMGEQGAKTLRGGKMEDVIFAGTAGRAPLGRAEVSLTIDNTDGALPIDYSEVTISRTLFRNGGSEYAINGAACRLLDVQELLSDTGMGRQMHVIVGQGQLDAILRATPEERRGFIEESAGVLKHRRRKEKALRKLESMAANLTRLQDLTAEIRRQLGPLAKQAQVARRASVIQADLRDASARLLADELAQAIATHEQESADFTELERQQQAVAAQLEQIDLAVKQAEARIAEAAPQVDAAAETWYRLSSIRERLRGLHSLATQRVTLLSEVSDPTPGADPEELAAQAKRIRAAESELEAEVHTAAATLETAAQFKEAAEAKAAKIAQEIARLQRAAADRREGHARLAGEVEAHRGRLESGQHEITRIDVEIAQLNKDIAEAERSYRTVEMEVADIEAGEVDLDAAYEAAKQATEELAAELEQVTAQLRATTQERATLSARLEALDLSLTRRDGAGALLSDPDAPDVGGSVAASLRVEPGYETAVNAALGPYADAVVVQDDQQATTVLQWLKQQDAGRAALVVSDTALLREVAIEARDKADARRLSDLVEPAAAIAASVQLLLADVLVTDDLASARTLHAKYPELRIVTVHGDLLGPAHALGGSTGAPSVLQLQAEYDETARRRDEVEARIKEAELAQTDLTEKVSRARDEYNAALAQLHDSDAQISAVAARLARIGEEARRAQATVDRLTKQREERLAQIQVHQAAMEDAEMRLQAVTEDPEESQARIDQALVEQNDLDATAARARTAETEAQLVLRTNQERARALAGRAESLERSAAEEKKRRDEAAAAALQREQDIAAARRITGQVELVLEKLETSLSQAAVARDEAQRERQALQRQAEEVRAKREQLRAEQAKLADVAHREEIARTQREAKLDHVRVRAMDELGIDPDVLIEEYGPHLPVPVRIEGDDGDQIVHQPYVREEQMKRLKAAQRAMTLLGRVNPLAMEEHAALEERHKFLTEQLDDLKRSRADLLHIVREVDERVERVFAEAFADTEAQFAQVFSRLFPGGEGRLILTDPSDMLGTGVEVEARPAGKKVKRLSLLSGGERSLAAIAMLVAIFKARPSPFYVMDEVEAALDDVNLSRLLDIFRELQTDSQLIVITHQKRTMEIADALYGVTMRGDGVTTVISQRLGEAV